MRPRDRAHDCQPQSSPAPGAPPVGAGEALKGAILEVGPEAVPLVSDPELGPVAVGGGAEADPASAVTQRVVDQVAQRLLDPEGIELGVRARRRLQGDRADPAARPTRA